METERLILKLQEKKGFTNWAFDCRFWDLVKKDSKQIIGHCGFHTWNKDSHHAEISYELTKNFRKKGFMREAIQPIIIHGFDEMKLNRIEAYIKIKNLPSRKLINNLGFTSEEKGNTKITNQNYIEYFFLDKSKHFDKA